MIQPHSPCVAPPEADLAASPRAVRPDLLVSCRCLAEARAALAGGADIIDLKAPEVGPLGATDLGIWQAIRLQTTGVPLTAAAGELIDWLSGRQPLGPLKAAAVGLAGIKFGTSGLGSRAGWVDEFRHLAAQLPTATSAIPVAFADRDAASSPPWPQVIAAAAAVGSRFVLVDTYDKRHGTLLSIWDDRQLMSFAQTAAAIGLRVAIAGRLRASDIMRLPFGGIDVVGFRSAACEHENRVSQVSKSRVTALVSAIDERYGAAGNRPQNFLDFASNIRIIGECDENKLNRSTRGGGKLREIELES